MDSQPEPSSHTVPAPPSAPLHAVAPAAPPRPRVWTVFLAFGLLVATLTVAGAILFGVALAVELARTGANASDPAVISAMVEKLQVTPWLLVVSGVMSSTTTLTVALLGARLSPRPLRERLRLGAGLPLSPGCGWPPWWAAPRWGRRWRASPFSPACGTGPRH